MDDYKDPNQMHFLRVICPNTIPLTIQNNRVLMVYGDNDYVIGCFFSLDECANYFKISIQSLKNLMYKRQKILGLYTPMWVKVNNKKKGWHPNEGEL